MSKELVDPDPAPEGGAAQMRAADLKNKVVLLCPTEHDTVEGKDGKPWEFVACNVWVLDRQGIVEEGTNVRISWWKAIAQLKDKMGEFVGAKPTEQDDRSVELVPLSGDARKIAAQVVADLSGEPAAKPGEEPEPF